MKNKKYLVSLLVLVALLCLGIGYAAVSKDLVVTGRGATYAETVTDPEYPGTTDPLKENFKVKFDSATKIVSDDTKVTSVVIEDEEVTFSVNNLYIKDGYVTITLKIVNESADLKAIIAKPVPTNSNATYFAIETDWPEAGVVLAPSQSQAFTITIKVIKSAIEHQYADFTITFVAEAALA